LIIDDFGASEGRNSVYVMKTIIDYLRKTKNDMREPLVVHNDLPTNDWTSFFQLLIDDNSYKGVASDRSFYEQCLPNDSLSIGYLAASIHWLSSKPCNVSDHCYVGFARDLKEREAFKDQARLDYCHFLKNRSRELLRGGVLILAIYSRNDQEQSGGEDAPELLYKCAQALPLTTEELLDFTIPWYLPSYKERVDEELCAQYSFQLIKSDMFPAKSPLFKQ
jgi:hypothetical protein